MNPRWPLIAAFACGGLSLLWIGWGYVGHHPAALAAIAIILGFYLLGAQELRGFWHDTRALDHHLARIVGPVDDIESWLATLPTSLRHAVRQRVETGSSVLPGPALAPYLAGLLVLLGMTGTFIGMVATLRGTGLALETATDVAGIRSSLAAPVKGLGLAFGTSVAGVAASAMLGLMSALCRRDRQQVARRLDGLIATHLRAHGAAHHRQALLGLLQRQADAIQAGFERAAAQQAEQERRSQQGAQHWLDAAARQDEARASQAREARDAASRQQQALLEAVQNTLGSPLRQALSDALDRGSQQTAAVLEPLVVRTLEQVAHSAASWQQRLVEASAQQFDSLTARIDSTATQMAAGWQAALLEAQAGQLALLDKTREAHAELARAFENHLHDVRAQGALQVSQLLSETADVEQRRADQWSHHIETSARKVGAELTEAAHRITEQLELSAKATVAEIGGLVRLASQAPQAAADVVGELRQRLSESLARDNQALAEREQLMQTTAQVLSSLQHAAGDQRGAIDRLLSLTENQLNQAITRLADHAGTQTDRMAQAAVQLAAGSVELASLGDAFAAAVAHYGEANQALISHLERIESALERQIARSDDQLTYTVAQARELIDLSVLSQKRLLDEMQLLARREPSSAIADT